MIKNKKKFYLGLGMITVFTVLLVGMFLPIFDGNNMLENSDELYNKISKDSAYYIDTVLEDSQEYEGTIIDVTIEMDDETEAVQTALLYEKSGAEATVSGMDLHISGDLGKIMDNAAYDAEFLYADDLESLENKYGYDGRRVLYNWNESLMAMDDEFKDLKLSDEAKAVAEVAEKAVQPAYNYFSIEPEKMSDKSGIVIGSLAYYIIYTVLYGFALMFLFEGWGLKMGAH